MVRVPGLKSSGFDCCVARPEGGGPTEGQAGEGGIELRPLRSESQLRNAARHVAYEIDMLLYTARSLGSLYSSPPSGLSEPQQNVALESFLLHFRNLRAFLCPSLQATGVDDVIAGDFLHRSEAIDVGDAAALAADKQRLDRMLAHLSYSRDKYIAAGDAGWPIEIGRAHV